MTKYQKIPSLWKRESEKPHRLLVGQYASPEVEFLKDVQWFFTEKVDGTNIRVEWDGHEVSFAGRTDNAQLPPHLLRRLEDMFDVAMVELIEQQFGDTTVVFYGEGFGAKIQKGGGLYRDHADFILFDVMVDQWMLQRRDVVDVGRKLDIEVVPTVLLGTIPDAITFMQDVELKSVVANEARLAEGIVGMPQTPLYTRSGDRIAVKIKPADVQA